MRRVEKSESREKDNFLRYIVFVCIIYHFSFRNKIWKERMNGIQILEHEESTRKLRSKNFQKVAKGRKWKKKLSFYFWGSILQIEYTVDIHRHRDTHSVV